MVLRKIQDCLDSGMDIKGLEIISGEDRCRVLGVVQSVDENMVYLNSEVGIVRLGWDYYYLGLENNYCWL